ncbi:UDP-forming cellulose synthase catalytic subunit [Acidicapsa ligni]|uniref:UDP-forming cellulose synthase catalytic subunit n=1 Tax=Acidicapsa ligni TaxID=542300 RepID=UPI0021DFFA74|nr:UDP-forming cellulose synthase catalytic subunit [Acidicapsa ligni]
MATNTFSRSIARRGFRTLVFVVCTFLLFQFISLYLSWPKQVVLGGFTLIIAILLNRLGKSHVVTLSLMLLSLAATLRYGWWRIHLVANYFTDESNKRVGIDAALMLVLLSAEAYTFCIMVLGYMQTSFLLRRKPIPLPADEALWPHVDVLIPTYNEPLSLVRYTALAAINIDYPPEKLHVYILDDGTREDFRKFSEEAGIGYVTRKKHNHAKAGNINHALTKMTSSFVAIFDCDHVPTRSFLQFTVGWFLAEKKLAMLQTPHFFYSPDPFERNLLQYKSIPNEGELFYGIIQDGNDFWNATFFCGSCAVLRREALDEVGGIATETVTEDAHTSLRMQSRGWNTAYINMAQAAGLATETLAAHVGQRVRWARGMIQILRTNNPLLCKGMKFTQRLCYFNAMLHFMYAVPRLIFLLAPLAYMLFGRTIIPGYWLAILAYALPHLMISSLTNSRIQGRHRHSFWNEIYETVLAPYILLPTILALINPKLGSFNVTDKGTTLSETQFDRKIAAPTTWMLLANLVGVLAAPYRLFVLDPMHPGVIISNLCWILFNMVILGVAAAVAHEQRQRRSSVRIPARIPIVAELPDRRQITGITRDMSVGGASVALSNLDIGLQNGDMVRLAFPLQTGDEQITATVIGMQDDELRLQFVALTLFEQETLTRALYSRADSWMNVRANTEDDRPFVSLLRIIRLSFTGFKQVALGLLPRKARASSPAAVQTVSTILLALLWLLGTRGLAQRDAIPDHPYRPSSGPVSIAGTGSGEVGTRITLEDMGVNGAAEMRGSHSYTGVHFVLPHTLMPREARLRLSYRFSRMLGPHGGSIQVRLNNTLLGEVVAPLTSGDDKSFSFTTLEVSPELLVRDNDLSFEFRGSSVLPSGAKAVAQISATIGESSVIEIVSSPLALRNDLSLLPLPFYDPALQTTATIPFVFLGTPDTKTLQAAGIVASWLGILTGAKPARFSASIGEIPSGNVIIFSNKSSALPLSLRRSTANGWLAIEANPSDATGNALVLAGESDDQLLAVAQTLAMMKSNVDSTVAAAAPMQGDTLQVNSFAIPAQREADDAPRWMPSDRLVSLWKYSSETKTQGDGSAPIPAYFRVAPDLYYGEAQNLPLQVSYRYNSEAVAAGSVLRMYINGALINEAPLATGTGPIERRRQALLPVVNMRPVGNTLLFNFDFAPKLNANGTQNLSAPLQGSILQNTWIDLRGLDHWVQMPDLELFANGGFPFTRWADLSHTIVVLPDNPSVQEISLFLQMMSHCGTQTGYPALRVKVAGPQDEIDKDYDYLVLGTVGNQPAFAALQGKLPVSFDTDGVHVKQIDTTAIKLHREWQRIFHLDEKNKAPNNDDGVPDAVVQGIESPYAAGHSMIVIALRDDSSEEGFVTALLKRSQSSDMSHTVSMLTGTRFVSYAVATPGYHIGDISAYTEMRIWLTKYFWLLVVIVTLCSLILARWTNEYLKERAVLRLHVETTAEELV